MGSTDTVIENISFVVVARNEETALGRCLDSITRLELVDCEVICVNSLSTDRTLDIMMAYQSRHSYFTVLSPEECWNSAIARNHGVNTATKSKIFFIDGDIELNHRFVQAALEELKNPDVFAVTGDLEEFIYDDFGEALLSKKKSRFGYTERHFVLYCGGTFIVQMKAIRATGHYDERFFRSQDIDYVLRLTTKFPMIALPMPMGVHHTGEYKNRPWLHFRNGAILNQGMLARKHFRRHGFWNVWYRSRKVFVWGFIVVNLLFLFIFLYILGLITWVPLAIFTTMLLAFEVAYSIYRKQSLVSTSINHLLSPYAVFLGFLAEPFIDKSGQRAKKGEMRFS